MAALIEAVGVALQNPARHQSERRDVLSKVFYMIDGNAARRAGDAVLDYYEEFLSKQGRSGRLSRSETSQ